MQTMYLKQNASPSVSCWPPAEALLFSVLSGDRSHGVLFTRDCIIGDQIIELCSRQHKVAVELDVPKTPTLEDEARMEILRDRGYRVVHVTSAEIYKDPYEVACRIVSAAQENHRRAVRRSIARLAV